VLAPLDGRHRQASAGPWASGAFLERVLKDALARRAHPHLAWRVRRAALKTPTPLEGFEGRLTPTMNRQQVRHLASGDAIRQQRHVRLGGPPGVGTRHRAHALAHEACRPGCDGLVVHPHQRRHHRQGGRADGRWSTRLQLDLRPEWLVLEDCGRKPLADPAPSDLSDVMNERAAVGSLSVTSHRAPPRGPTSLAIRAWPPRDGLAWRLMPSASSSPGAGSGPKGASPGSTRGVNVRRQGGDPMSTA
jgi:DNA replication protein DnaC